MINVDEVERMARSLVEGELANRFDETAVAAYIAKLDHLLSNFIMTMVCPELYLMIRGWLKAKHAGGICVGHSLGYGTPCQTCRSANSKGRCWLMLYSDAAWRCERDWFTLDPQESVHYWEYRAAAALANNHELDCRFAVWMHWWLGLEDEGTPWNQAVFTTRYHEIIQRRKEIEAEDRQRAIAAERIFQAKKKVSN